MSEFAQAFIEKDPTIKGYLKQVDIEDIFKQRLGISYSRAQFNIIFSALEPNSEGAFNYKQLMELAMGLEEAQKFFQGAAMGGGKFGGALALTGNQPKFVMPV